MGEEKESGTLSAFVTIHSPSYERAKMAASAIRTGTRVVFTTKCHEVGIRVTRTKRAHHFEIGHWTRDERTAAKLHRRAVSHANHPYMSAHNGLTLWSLCSCIRNQMRPPYAAPLSGT